MWKVWSGKLQTIKWIMCFRPLFINRQQNVLFRFINLFCVTDFTTDNCCFCRLCVSSIFSQITAHGSFFFLKSFTHRTQSLPHEKTAEATAIKTDLIQTLFFLLRGRIVEVGRRISGWSVRPRWPLFALSVSTCQFVACSRMSVCTRMYTKAISLKRCVWLLEAHREFIELEWTSTIKKLKWFLRQESCC